MKEITNLYSGNWDSVYPLNIIAEASARGLPFRKIDDPLSIDLRMFEKALQKLPEENLKILEMKYRDGIPFTKIGETLGMHPSTVGQKAGSALWKISRFYEECVHEEMTAELEELKEKYNELRSSSYENRERLRKIQSILDGKDEIKDYLL